MAVKMKRLSKLGKLRTGGVDNVNFKVSKEVNASEGQEMGCRVIAGRRHTAG